MLDKDYFKHLQHLPDVPTEYAYPYSVLSGALAQAQVFSMTSCNASQLRDQIIQAANKAANTNGRARFKTLSRDIERFSPDDSYFEQAYAETRRFFSSILQGKTSPPDTTKLIDMLAKRWDKQSKKAALAKFNE